MPIITNEQLLNIAKIDAKGSAEHVRQKKEAIAAFLTAVTQFAGPKFSSRKVDGDGITYPPTVDSNGAVSWPPQATEEMKNTYAKQRMTKDFHTALLGVIKDNAAVFNLPAGDLDFNQDTIIDSDFNKMFTRLAKTYVALLTAETQLDDTQENAVETILNHQRDKLNQDAESRNRTGLETDLAALQKEYEERSEKVTMIDNVERPAAEKKLNEWLENKKNELEKSAGKLLQDTLSQLKEEGEATTLVLTNWKKARVAVAAVQEELAQIVDSSPINGENLFKQQKALDKAIQQLKDATEALKPYLPDAELKKLNGLPICALKDTRELSAGSGLRANIVIDTDFSRCLFAGFTVGDYKVVNNNPEAIVRTINCKLPTPSEPNDIHYEQGTTKKINQLQAVRLDNECLLTPVQFNNDGKDHTVWLKQEHEQSKVSLIIPDNKAFDDQHGDGLNATRQVAMLTARRILDMYKPGHDTLVINLKDPTMASMVHAALLLMKEDSAAKNCKIDNRCSCEQPGRWSTGSFIKEMLGEQLVKNYKSLYNKKTSSNTAKLLLEELKGSQNKGEYKTLSEGEMLESKTKPGVLGG